MSTIPSFESGDTTLKTVFQSIRWFIAVIMVLDDSILWYYWFKAGIASNPFLEQRSPLIDQSSISSGILMIKFVFMYLFGRQSHVNRQPVCDGAPSYLCGLWTKSFCDQYLNLGLD